MFKEMRQSAREENVGILRLGYPLETFSAFVVQSLNFLNIIPMYENNIL
jgi:hypothetical protein